MMLKKIIKIIRNIICLVGLICLSPLLIIAGLIIIIEDGLPVFFVQERIGLNKGHLWEQIDLPLYLNRNNKSLLINLTNSAPISYSNQISTIHDLSIYDKTK